MGSAFQFIDDYEVSRGGRSKSDPAGVALLMRDHGDCLDIVPSPSAAYLLPNLFEFSPVRKESVSLGHGQVKLLDHYVIYVMAGLKEGLSPYALGAPMSAEAAGAPEPFGPAIAGLAKGGRLELPPIPVGPRREASRGIAPLPVPSNETMASLAVDTRQGPSECDVAEDAVLTPDASIAEIASRIARLSGLGDGSLAKLFGVERETFCRWRTGVLKNPRVGNRRRLGLLLRLLEDLDGRQVHINNWLLNQLPTGDLTPYDLLAQGRIDEVAHLAVAIGVDVVEGDTSPLSVSEATDQGLLVFDDDDQWAVVNVEGEQHDR
jgi:hypothetical protein